MDVELFVHGVPKGEDFWGKEEDKKYFANFYNGNASDKVRFLVQTRMSNDKLYCYYNYLVYENVVDCDWRPNSYFGISLRFNAYCKDFLNVYRILDSSYNFYVRGKMIKYEKSKLKYAIPGFARVSGILKNIECEVLKQISEAFSQDSFVNLNGFPKSSGNVLEYNLYECSIEDIQNDMRRYGQVALSPYYPSSKEKKTLLQCQQQVAAAKQQYQNQAQTVTQQSQQKIEEVKRECDKEIKRVKEDCEKQKKEINDALESAKSKNDQQKKTIDDKDSEITAKEKELTRLKKENEKKGQYKSIEDIVASIQKPIKELAISMQSIAPEEPQGGETQHPPQEDEKSRFGKLRQGFVDFLHKYLNTILLVLILVLLVVHSPKPADDPVETDETVVTEEQPEVTESEEPPLDDIIESKLRNVRIDISGYNGGDLKKGKKYKVQAIDGVAEGTWEVNGGEAVTNTDDPNMIYVTPTEDSVEIIYCVGSRRINWPLKAE